MASRNHYTYTPGYHRGGRHTPPHGSEYAQDPRSAAARMQMAQARRPSGDTFILTLLFLVAPLCGILSVFVKVFLWIFVAVALLALAAMWALRCFAPRGRAFLSGILVVLTVISLVSTVDTSPRPGYFQTYGNDPALSSGQSNASSNQGSSHNPDDPGGLYNQEPQPTRNTQAILGYAGLSGASPAATPPVASVDERTDANAENALGGTPVISANGQPQPITSAAQEVLNNYLRMWAEQNFEAMVDFTTPEWRSAVKTPQRQLNWTHASWLLNNWTIIPEAQSPTADSVTLKVIADLTKRNSTKTREVLEYTALVLNKNGTWFVDPDSLRNGYAPLPTEPPEIITNISAEAGTTPTPTTDPSLKLWYNTSGGKMYHLQQKCPSINERNYQHMKSFTFSKLGDKDFSKLEPCSVCGAPKRPK